MNPAEYDNLREVEETMWWFRGMRKILFHVLDGEARRRRVRRALDAGCGTGAMARALSARYGWEMTGVDLSYAGLSKGIEAGVQGLAQCDAGRLPFADGSFGAVVSLDMLVCFEAGAEAQALSEFARVLEPGGLLAVRVSALDVLRSRHSEFVGERQRFTAAGLARALEAAGFRTLRATYANALLLPVALAKFRVWEPLARAAVESAVKPLAPWLDGLLYAPLDLEARWIASGRNLPVGQSVVLIGEKA
jgi:ubiquinone/menaquinone biosynthesis C-methylase UbiE